MPLEVSDRCIYNGKARRRLCAPGGDVVIMMVLAEILFWMMILSADRSVVMPLALTCLGVHAIAINMAARKRVRLWREFAYLLQPQLEDRYGVPLNGAACFGIAPGRINGQFQGDRIWDIGFVEVGDRLSFYGDQSVFSLDRGRIKSVRCRNGTYPRLEIEFIGDGGTSDWIALEYRGSMARGERLVEAQRLRTKIAIMPDASEGKPVHFPFVTRQLTA